MPDADAALERHRDALRERFPLPPQALGPMPAAPPPRPRRRAVRATLAALLCAGTALLVAVDPAWRTEHVATGPQQRLTVQLADGSSVQLDAGTRLAVSRHLRSRQVALHAGRALFDVQPSAWRPFTVDAGSAQVRVVGTVFDVRRRGGSDTDDDVTVTVLRGRVAVQGESPASNALLSPGEQVHVALGVLQPMRPVDTQAATAWRDGQLVFQRTSLPEVLAEITRYTGRPVRLGDASLATLEISGVYRTANADALLALLPGIVPVRLERAADGAVTVLRAGR